MSFGSVSEFFAMGGHGLYVWLSYGVSLLVVLANVLFLSRARRRQWRELEDQLRRQQRAASAAADAATDNALARVAETDR